MRHRQATTTYDDGRTRPWTPTAAASIAGEFLLTDRRGRRAFPRGAGRRRQNHPVYCGSERAGGMRRPVSLCSRRRKDGPYNERRRANGSGMHRRERDDDDDRLRQRQLVCIEDQCVSRRHPFSDDLFHRGGRPAAETIARARERRCDVTDCRLTARLRVLSAETHLIACLLDALDMLENKQEDKLPQTDRASAFDFVLQKIDQGRGVVDPLKFSSHLFCSTCEIWLLFLVPSCTFQKMETLGPRPL